MRNPVEQQDVIGLVQAEITVFNVFSDNVFVYVLFSCCICRGYVRG